MARIGFIRKYCHSHLYGLTRHLNVACSPYIQRTSVTASHRDSAVTLLSPYEGTTNRLAAILARISKAKDCICLYGDVGAGKSVFSRAFIRAIADDEDLPVPSPTYLLQNTYEEHEGPLVHHFDLYRLSGPAELGRLQLEDAFNSGICLIEWAERLGSCAPADHLQIHIELLSKKDKERIRRMQGMRELMDQASSFQGEPADVDPEESENAYIDRRWRRVVLIPKGVAWSMRIGCLAQELRDRPDQGLFLLSSLSQI